MKDQIHLSFQCFDLWLDIKNDIKATKSKGATEKNKKRDNSNETKERSSIRPRPLPLGISKSPLRRSPLRGMQFIENDPTRKSLFGEVHDAENIGPNLSVDESKPFGTPSKRQRRSSSRRTQHVNKLSDDN